MKPWYHEGLQFECLPNCGNCCEGIGHVRLTDKDRMRLPGYTGGTLPKRGDKCAFLTACGECSVYMQRPNQCRMFPFWDSSLISRSHWDSLRFRCPGIGRGKLWTEGEILQQQRRRR